MRILNVNKYHFMNGGTERYYFHLTNLLEKNGHQVAEFAMDHPKNRKSTWSRYFVSFVNLKKPRETGWSKALGRLFYSLEAKQKMSNLLDHFKPDIVHIHNLYGHISPSILPEIYRRGIPIVQTVHDYHLIHPNVVRFHHGNLCDLTHHQSCLKAISHHCVDDSIIYSIPPVLAFWFHQKYRFYSRYISFFITPSLHMRQTLLDFGYPEKKLIHFTNPISPKSSSSPPLKNSHILYFGRFTEHKGLKTIIESAKNLPHIPFYLVGEGKLTEYLSKQIKENKMHHVHLLPFTQGQKLSRLISSSCGVLVPSLWEENQPYSVLEAFAAAKPVIACRIGGLPELVTNRQRGLLVPPGNSTQLTSAIQFLWDNPDKVSSYGKNAYEHVIRNHNPESHYHNLLDIYQKALERAEA